mgnify:CR=1 FL=1
MSPLNLCVEPPLRREAVPCEESFDLVRRTHGQLRINAMAREHRKANSAERTTKGLHKLPPVIGSAAQ